MPKDLVSNACNRVQNKGQSTDTDRTGVAAGAWGGQCLLHGYNASLGVVQTV